MARDRAVVRLGRSHGDADHVWNLPAPVLPARARPALAVAPAQLVRQALGELGPRERRSILWAMRRNPSGWSETQANAMHWLQRANLKSAGAWRLKTALREVYALARSHHDADQAAADLRRWISWARRSRLAQFKRLGATLRDHFDAVVRGMLDHRSNAFVEGMNGPMQQAKRAARGFRTAVNFIAISYLRLSKLTAFACVALRPRHAAYFTRLVTSRLHWRPHMKRRRASPGGSIY